MRIPPAIAFVFCAGSAAPAADHPANNPVSPPSRPNKLRKKHDEPMIEKARRKLVDVQNEKNPERSYLTKQVQALGNEYSIRRNFGLFNPEKKLASPKNTSHVLTPEDIRSDFKLRRSTLPPLKHQCDNLSFKSDTSRPPSPDEQPDIKLHTPAENTEE